MKWTLKELNETDTKVSQIVCLSKEDPVLDKTME